MHLLEASYVFLTHQLRAEKQVLESQADRYNIYFSCIKSIKKYSVYFSKISYAPRKKSSRRRQTGTIFYVFLTYDV